MRTTLGLERTRYIFLEPLTLCLCTVSAHFPHILLLLSGGFSSRQPQSHTLLKIWGLNFRGAKGFTLQCWVQTNDYVLLGWVKRRLVKVREIESLSITKSAHCLINVATKSGHVTLQLHHTISVSEATRYPLGTKAVSKQVRCYIISRYRQSVQSPVTNKSFADNLSEQLDNTSGQYGRQWERGQREVRKEARLSLSKTLQCWVIQNQNCELLWKWAVHGFYKKRKEKKRKKRWSLPWPKDETAWLCKKQVKSKQAK